MTTTILGLKQLRRNIDQTSRDLMEAEDPAQMAAGEVIRDKWRALVPVLEGNYRDSLAVQWLGKKGAAVGTSWLGSVERNEQPVLYASRLEFGDSEMPAQPSARPALEQSRGPATDAAADEFRSVIRGTRRRRTQPIR